MSEGANEGGCGSPRGQRRPLEDGDETGEPGQSSAANGATLDGPSAKRQRVGGQDERGEPEGGDPPAAALLGPGLLDLSDDVLLLILRHLPCSYDLVHLAATCRRLERVAKDRSLWVSVVAGSSPVPSYSSSTSYQSLREIRRLLPFLHADTLSLCVRGNVRSPCAPASVARREVVSPSLLREVAKQCPRLRSLSLEGCFVDAKKVSLDHMPTTLTALSLRGSEVVNIKQSDSYFKGADETLPTVTRLDLTGCSWLSNHSLMAIAKLPVLTSLVLRDCPQLGDAFAYTALSTRCGLKELQELDLRGTGVTDTEFSCFARLPKLRRLLCGPPLEIVERTGDKEKDRERAEGALSQVLTDRALSSISVLARQGGHTFELEELCMAHTSVTNQVMDTVGKSLPSLRRLDVRGTRVTEEGACSLAKGNPDCEVLFDRGEENPLAGTQPPEEARAGDLEQYVLIQAPHFQA